jgi:hypothetical protein
VVVGARLVSGRSRIEGVEIRVEIQNRGDLTQAQQLIKMGAKMAQEGQEFMPRSLGTMSASQADEGTSVRVQRSSKVICSFIFGGSARR